MITVFLLPCGATVDVPSLPAAVKIQSLVRVWGFDHEEEHIYCYDGEADGMPVYREEFEFDVD